MIFCFLLTHICCLLGWILDDEALKAQEDELKKKPFAALSKVLKNKLKEMSGFKDAAIPDCLEIEIWHSNVNTGLPIKPMNVLTLVGDQINNLVCKDEYCEQVFTCGAPDPVKLETLYQEAIAAAKAKEATKRSTVVMAKPKDQSSRLSISQRASRLSGLLAKRNTTAETFEKQSVPISILIGSLGTSYDTPVDYENHVTKEAEEFGKKLAVRVANYDPVAEAEKAALMVEED